MDPVTAGRMRGSPAPSTRATSASDVVRFGKGPEPLRGTPEQLPAAARAVPVSCRRHNDREL